MRYAAILATLIAGLSAAPAAALEPLVGPGEEVEARVDGDLNGDGAADIAYVIGTAEWRELRVVLSARGGARPAEALALETTFLGPGSLAIDGNVLKFEDLTGGTTAVASTRRFRYDALRKRMRLIGLDATVYSRTFAHDGFEASWNLINGDSITRELKLNVDGGDAAYDQVHERRFKLRVRPQWLSEAPDPEEMLEEMRQE